MPFLAHFGLTSYPFGLTPDPRLFYPSQQARSLLAGLEFALMRGDGLLKVVGEVGTGKTLIARLLLEKLAGLPVNTAYLNIPIVVADQLPTLVAREFGVKVANNSLAMRQLKSFLLAEHSAGRHNVLIVDEAQALGAEGLETVRLLSNLETSTNKLLQIVLFGQRELDIILQNNNLRQIAQRIQFSFITKPMSEDTVADYVRFRMEHCLLPEANRAVFEPRAMRGLFRASKGLPRVVNLLADKALISAYAEGSYTIKPHHVRVSIKETPDVKTNLFSYIF